MAFSYPMRNKKNLILPSVENWGINTNIIKDPPKSIQTRRIDKPQMTTSINEMIDLSGDRASESIRVYSRGINPMVSVSYDNYGNNGGGRVSLGNNTALTSNQTAKIHVNNVSLPYKSQVFRPPIRTSYDLLPLSRLPRGHIHDVTATTNFVDWTKSRPLAPAMTKNVELKQLLQAYKATPKKIINISTPFKENFTMKENINQKHINVEALSGKKTADRFEKEQWDSQKHVSRVILDTRNDSVKTSEYTKEGEINFLSDNFVREDPLQADAYTNKYDSRINIPSEYENEIIQERNLPLIENLNSQYSYSGYDSFDSMNIQGRDYNRVKDIDYGGFTDIVENTVRPKDERQEIKVRTGNSEREDFRNKINEQQFGRNALMPNSNYVHR